jgi:8-oxo-dGTP diphosphatase
MPKEYRFCPRCGGLLEQQHPHGLSDEPAQPTCASCGFIFWQNSKPCAGVLVVDQGRLLLVRRGFEPFKGWWDVPGGFLTEGEHPEAGAVRELKEETGLSIRLTGLVGIFMDVYETSGDATLNVFYAGEVAGGEAAAGSDATDMRWFAIDELPEHIAFACNRQAINVWLARQQL